MIAARSGRTDITNILLEGKHINLDIQENVSVYYIWLLPYTETALKYKPSEQFMYAHSEIHMCTLIDGRDHLFLSEACL